MSEFTLKDHHREFKLFLSRSVVAGVLVTVALGTVVLRLVQLQVVRHEHFTTLSQDNSVKLDPLPPTRGLIYDANGILLAENYAAFSLEIIPEKAGDVAATIDRLEDVLPISENDRWRFERLRRQVRAFDRVPIRSNLTEEEMARFAVVSHSFPGVDVRANLLRRYPLGEDTAHVLGYVGRINEKELEQINVSEYRGTDFIGKTGVEKSYEEYLHGRVGVQQVEVNARGRVLRVLESQPPTSGYDLHLYFDVGLQQEAAEALGEFNGAVVAIEPSSGGILAMVSRPSFDPNLFVEGISTEDYQALRDSADKPLFNRALRGQYPPGSTIKPFVALAGLESGVIGYTDTKYCPGYYQLPGNSHKYRDWRKGGHGLVDMDRAVVESCDVYFYDLARSLGIDRMGDFLGRFGFGHRTEADLYGELGGVLPSREWKRSKRGKPWFPGETLIVGIGQGSFLATPLQLAAATAALANRGRIVQPRVVRYLDVPPAGEPPTLDPPRAESIALARTRYWDDVIRSMTNVVESERGTARRVRTPAYHIAGKTGTAQVFTVGQNEKYDEKRISEKMRDHALFIGFAPAEDPKIAVAVVAENGGHGGATAAPIARRVMDRYLFGQQLVDAGR
jgi:penicillin-binding protein 2